MIMKQHCLHAANSCAIPRFHISTYVRIIYAHHKAFAREVVALQHADAVRIIDRFQEDLVDSATHMTTEINAFRTGFAFEQLLEDNYYRRECEPEHELELVKELLKKIHGRHK